MSNRYLVKYFLSNDVWSHTECDHLHEVQELAKKFEQTPVVLEYYVKDTILNQHIKPPHKVKYLKWLDMSCKTITHSRFYQ